MSKEEKEVLYQCYLESGLSVKKFADLNNVKPAVIRGLVSYHKRIESREKSCFISVITKEEKAKNKLISFKLDNHNIEIDSFFLKLFLGAITNDWFI